MKGERAQVALHFVPNVKGVGMNVESLESVGTIKWTWRDRVIDRGVHVKPPKQVGRTETRTILPKFFPNFLAADQSIGLFPEMMFVERTIIPAVPDDSVFGWKSARQVGRLSRAGKRRHDGLDQERFPRGSFGKGREAGRVLAQKSIAQADHVKNCHPGAIGTPAHHHRLCFLKSPMPSVQVFDGFENFLLVHRVYFNSFAYALNQGDGEFSTEMFPEFLKALEN